MEREGRGLFTAGVPLSEAQKRDLKSRGLRKTHELGVPDKSDKILPSPTQRRGPLV